MTPTTRKRWIYVVVGVIAVIVAVGVYSKYDPMVGALFPKCPFKVLTGWSCPGCGLQRAFHALLDGQLGKALSYNYFFVLSIPYATVVVVSEICRRQRRALRFVAVAQHRYGMYA